MSLSDDRSDYDFDGHVAPNAYERTAARRGLLAFEAATDQFHFACRAAARAFIEALAKADLLDARDARIRQTLAVDEAAEGFAEEVEADLILLARGWIKERALQDLRETAGEG